MIRKDHPQILQQSQLHGRHTQGTDTFRHLQSMTFFSLSLSPSSPLRIHDVPPGSAVWVWLNNYKLQAADLSFTFLNMPTCAFCGDANQYQSFSHYCHWKYSGSMFVLFPGFWRYNVAQQFAASANNTKELHNKSFLYLLSPPLCHWN